MSAIFLLTLLLQWVLCLGALLANGSGSTLHVLLVLGWISLSAGLVGTDMVRSLLLLREATLNYIRLDIAGFSRDGKFYYVADVTLLKAGLFLWRCETTAKELWIKLVLAADSLGLTTSSISASWKLMGLMFLTWLWLYRATLVSALMFAISVYLTAMRILLDFLVLQPLRSIWQMVCSVGHFIYWLVFWPVEVVMSLKERFAMEGKMMPIGSDKVPVETLESKLDAILNSLRRGSILESMQAGSAVLPQDTWPYQVCSIRNSSGGHIGFGFFTVLKGKWVCVTCRHVLAQAPGGSMWTPKRNIAIGDAKIIFGSSMDVIGFAVDPNTAASLGCKKMEIKQTPSNGRSVSIFGYLNGEIVRTLGNISGPTDKALKFVHSCSTTKGFCGSPLILGDKNVVGIHRETTHLGVNMGFSFDLLLSTLERSDEYDDDKHLYGQFDEDDLDWENEDEHWYLDGEGFKVNVGRRRYRAAKLASVLDLDVTVGKYRSYSSTNALWDTYTGEDDIPSLQDLKRDWGLESGKGKEKENSKPSLIQGLTVSPSSTAGTLTSDKKERKREKRRLARKRKALKKVPTVTSNSLESSEGLPVVDFKDTDRLMELTGSPTPNSTIGDGQVGMAKQPGQALVSTPASSKGKEKSLATPKGNRQLTRSVVKVLNIRRLERQLGSLESAVTDAGQKEKLNSLVKCLKELEACARK
nr:MAG: putative ORF2 polyprotein [Barnaviridae sp.]